MSSVIPNVTRFAPPVWALRLVRCVRRCAVSSALSVPLVCTNSDW